MKLEMFRKWAPLAALALLFPASVTPMEAKADSFATVGDPPSLSDISLTTNADEVFESIQPANSSSSDRYNVTTSVGIPAGHDALESLTMCMYLLDFEDCSNTDTINNRPEIVFKATHSVIRVGGPDSEVTDETFRVVGDNNYDVNVSGFESSTSVTREASESVNVDVTFTFKASNAMRASTNWKIYIEAEDRFGQTGATSRDGVRVEYFAAMVVDREGAVFGGVAKGETSEVSDIDSGRYTANAQSRFFVDATDFSAGPGKDLALLTSGQLSANQVELRCNFADSFDSSNSIMVTQTASQLADSIPPSSEDPVDAAHHSCSLRFGQGGANNPNLNYTNTFTLAIAASPLNAPTNISVTDEGVADPSTDKTLTFEPPTIISDGTATLESYRIQVINVDQGVTEETIRLTLADLQAGSDTNVTFTDVTSTVSYDFTLLTPDTNYEFVVEASTSRGFGSATSSQSSTELPELYDFSAETFLAGSSGRFGPSITQIREKAGNKTWMNEYLVQGAYQGQILWTVPDDATYRFDVAGARGASGGGGALVRGDFDLKQGQKLRMVVGQMGTTSGGVFGGGGGSFVADNSNNPLIVAGGGGGRGGSGSISTGNGYGSMTCAGGAGFFGNGSSSNTGAAALSFLSGATGGSATGSSAVGGFGGGGGGDEDGSFSSDDNGGGGGYQGGDGRCNGSGSGGFSFNSGANQSGTNGSNFGHGYISITKLD